MGPKTKTKLFFSCMFLILSLFFFSCKSDVEELSTTESSSDFTKIKKVHLRGNEHEGNFEILVSFNGPVVVHTKENFIPRIAFNSNLDSTKRHAEYYSGTGSSILVFRYDYNESHPSQPIRKVEMSPAIDLNGSSILDDSGKKITTLIFTAPKDFIIPETPSLSLFDGRSYGHDTRLKITVSELETAAKVTLYGDRSCKVKMSSTVTIPDGETIAHIKSDTISSERMVVYYARQIDAAGNISSCSRPGLFYTYDVTLPLAPSMLSLFSPSNNLSNDTTPEITVSGVEENAQVELYSDSSCSISSSSQISVPLGQSSITIEGHSINEH